MQHFLLSNYTAVYFAVTLPSDQLSEYLTVGMPPETLFKSVFSKMFSSSLWAAEIEWVDEAHEQGTGSGYGYVSQVLPSPRSQCVRWLDQMWLCSAYKDLQHFIGEIPIKARINVRSGNIMCRVKITAGWQVELPEPFNLLVTMTGVKQPSRNLRGETQRRNHATCCYPLFHLFSFVCFNNFAPLNYFFLYCFMSRNCLAAVGKPCQISKFEIKSFFQYISTSVTSQFVPRSLPCISALALSS